MKKLIVILMIAVLMLCGCSSKERDRTAIVHLPNGEIVQGTVNNFYVSSSGLVAVTVDGIEYKTHCNNVVVIERKE